MPGFCFSYDEPKYLHRNGAIRLHGELELGIDESDIIANGGGGC